MSEAAPSLYEQSTLVDLPDDALHGVLSMLLSDVDALSALGSTCQHLEAIVRRADIMWERVAAATGINCGSGSLGARAMVLHVHSAARMPRLVLVCFKFGARDAAQLLSKAGIPIVVWVHVDVHDVGTCRSSAKARCTELRLESH